MLLIPLIFGWLLATRGLKLGETWAALSVAAGSAVAFTVLGVNAIYRHYPLENALLTVLFAQSLLSLFLWRRPAPRTEDLRLSRATLAFVVISLAVIYLSTNTWQSRITDDDYWIHTPLQGLIKNGVFPPKNPFFTDLPMNGHYGRNLAIVTIAALSGRPPLSCQFWFTTFAQLVIFLLFFTALWRSTESQLQASLGTGFLFFGVNCGWRAGLFDTFQNNNSMVHLYLALITFLTLESWRKQCWTSALIGGLVLGGYGIVYETHYGLCVLALLSVAPLLHRSLGRKGLLCTVLMLAVSAPLAVTQGGPYTDIARRVILGQESRQPLSKGLQNQSQVVKITFPKKDLFQLKLETGEYQRFSFIYRLETPLNALREPALDRGYRYMWSWESVRIHFLALYLVPFSVWVLWRKKHPAGLFLGAFGTLSFIVPGLVDFGPIYESEYFRWEFAASLGFAGSLGLAAGSWLESFPRPEKALTYELNATALRLRLTHRALAIAAVAALTLANSLYVTHILFNWPRQAEGERLAFPTLATSLSEGWIPPSAAEWVPRHRVLDFTEADVKLASELAARVKAGDRLLSNFRHQGNYDILFESTLTGLTGVKCVGHALPRDDEKIGTTPFAMGPLATAFWSTGDPVYLRLLKVDWLYYRGRDDSLDPTGIEGLTLVAQEGRSSLFKVELPELEVPTPIEQTGSLPAWSEAFLPAHTRDSSYYQTEVLLENKGPDPLELKGYLYFLAGLKDDPQATLDLEPVLTPISKVLEPGASARLPVRLVTPRGDGLYELELFHLDGERNVSLGRKECLRVDFWTLLQQCHLREARIEPVRPGQVCTAEITLEAPEELPPGEVWVNSSSIRAGQPHFHRDPGELVTTVELAPDADGLIRFQIPTILPDKSGSWLLGVFLCEEMGKVHPLEAVNYQIP